MTFKILKVNHYQQLTKVLPTKLTIRPTLLKAQCITRTKPVGLIRLVRPFSPFRPFPFDIQPSAAPPSLSLAVLIVLTPTEGHSDTPLNIHIVADTPEGLHLGNRWSVSVANATTGCYSLSHHTPKGGYTREEQRVYR